MTVEPIRQCKGVSRAKAVCDICERDEVVSCSYSRPNKHAPTEPNQSQARAKVMGMGWTYIKGRLRCPACEAERKSKVVKMADVKASRAKEEKLREPTPQQRRDVFAMLLTVYDTDAGCYMQGDTDDTVAEVLGVMPGWVAEIRERDFGPDGGNEDMSELVTRVEQAIIDAGKFIAGRQSEIEKAEAHVEALCSISDQLEKIKKAVGPRNLKKAGV